jgi:hypothetical protein
MALSRYRITALKKLIPLPGMLITALYWRLHVTTHGNGFLRLIITLHFTANIDYFRSITRDYLIW